MERVMNFKRNIAFIGLLAGLFGSFSFLMSMEPELNLNSFDVAKRNVFVRQLKEKISQKNVSTDITIKDFNGQTAWMDLAQRDALIKCETLKPFLDAKEKPKRLETDTIDFSGLRRSFITRSNLKQLANILTDQKEIEKITDPKKIIELFQLADYLLAPQADLELIAKRAEVVLDEKITYLESLNQRDETLYRLRYKIEDFLRPKKLLRTRILEKANTNRYELYLNKDFFLEICPHKLITLDGIEKLIENPNLIRYLKVDGHALKRLDLAKLLRVFPCLEKVSLKNNEIQCILGNMQSMNGQDIKIDLSGNPIQSVYIEYPERLDRVNLIVDHPPASVRFVQTDFAKLTTWIKSLGAKSKVIIKYIMPSPTMVGIYAVAGAGLCLTGLLLKKLLQDSSDNIQGPLGSWPENFKFRIDWIKDDILKFRKILTPEDLELLRKLNPLVKKVLIENEKIKIEKITAQALPKSSFNEWLLPIGTWSFKTLLGGTFIHSVTNIIRSWMDWELWTMSDKLYHEAENHPFRVRIQPHNSKAYDFPSSYAYKLFGKNKME